MTAIRAFIQLAAEQPPAWQGAIAAVALLCAALVVVAFVELLVLGLPWLRDALDPDGVRRVRIDSPEAHVIAQPEQIDWPSADVALVEAEREARRI